MTPEILLYLGLAFAVGGAVLIFLAWRRPLVLLAAIILSRVVLDSFHTVTYMAVAQGLSIMQVYTVITIVGMFAFLAVRKGIPRLQVFLPLLVLVIVYLLSALFMNAWPGTVDGLIRWAFLYGLAALVVASAKFSEDRSIVLGCWLALIYPLVNQLYSIINNTPSYNAGQYSYIGTYSHESDLSFLILAFIFLSLILVVTSRGIRRTLFVGAVVYGHLALYLCNYRTTFVAVGVMWLVILARSWKRMSIGQKIATCIVSTLVVAFSMMTSGGDLSDRLADLYTFLSSPESYLDFSGQARRTGLMSGRLDLINAYMSRFLASPPATWFFGLGLGSVEDVVGVYAHNELISALVETGFIGLIALLYLIWKIMRLAVVRSEEASAFHICVEAGLYAVVVTTLGTMPFRDMRALIAFGVLLGLAEVVSGRSVIKRVSPNRQLQLDLVRYQVVSGHPDVPRWR